MKPDEVKPLGNIKHGHARRGKQSKEYKEWMEMKKRCYNPDNPDYKDYGALGVRVCERWFSSFKHFIADMGTSRPGTRLDLYPAKHGNYEPTNCRWATRRERASGTRHDASLTFGGTTRRVSEWAQITGIPYATIYARLNSQWGVERTLTEPPLE